MNRHKNCPLSWLYYKQKRVGIPLDDSDAQLGLNVHDMTDIYFDKIPDIPIEEDIREIAELVFDENFRADLSNKKRKGQRCWDNFIKFEIDRLRTWPVYKPTFTEKRLENHRFIGILDFYSEECGIAIDWKTGKLNQLWDSNLIEAKIYEELLIDNQHPFDKFYFVALQTGRSLEAPYVNKGWLDQHYDRMMRMIKRGDFPKIKGPLCPYCIYQLDCEFSDVCLWI